MSSLDRNASPPPGAPHEPPHQPPDEATHHASSGTPRTATEIALRDMTRADLHAVRSIESAAYEDAWPARAFESELSNAFARYRVAVERPTVTSEATVPPSPTWHRRLLRRLGLGRAPEQPRIVGFMGVWYMVDQLHLVTIAVAPDQQGRGIGQYLLHDCCALAIEADLPQVILEVRVTNERARALYTRFGFRRVGTLRGYYQDNGEDADVMIADLREQPARDQLLALRGEHRAHYGTRFAAGSEAAGPEEAD